MRTRVLLADDHKILRKGLRSLLEKDFEVVAEAEDGHQAIEYARRLNPDVIVMDVSMPGLNGIEAAERILAMNKNIHIVALSVHTDRRFIEKMIAVGAKAYLPKNCEYDELANAIRLVRLGRTYISRQISAAAGTGESYSRFSGEDASRLKSLTPSEREVLQLVAEGRTSKEIAVILKKSLKSVERYRHAIMEKLDIHSIAELTKYAINEGIISLDH